MPEYITPEEFRTAFMHAYNQLDFLAFVEHILQVTPRDNDVWQEEKFQLFQRAAQAFSRLSPEMLNTIIRYHKYPELTKL